MSETRTPVAPSSAGSNGAGTPQSNRDARAASGGGSADDFRRAAEAAKPGIVREFVDFLRHNKKWWLTPIIVILLLFGLLIVLAGTGAAPFIYTLF